MRLLFSTIFTNLVANIKRITQKQTTMEYVLYLIGVFFIGTGVLCKFRVEAFGLLPLFMMIFAGILLIAFGFVIDRLDDIKDLLRKQNRLLLPPKAHPKVIVKEEEKEDE